MTPVEEKLAAGTALLVRLRAREVREVKVLFGSKHWRPVAEGNCVVERRGGEQPEANYQSANIC